MAKHHSSRKRQHADDSFVTTYVLWAAVAIIALIALTLTTTNKNYYQNLSIGVPGGVIDVTGDGTTATVNVPGTASVTASSSGTGTVQVSGNGFMVSYAGGAYVNLSRSCDSDFSDVPDAHPFCYAINYLKDRSIISGYGDGTYRPDQVITRAEVLKVALNGGGADVSADARTPSVFVDVPLSHSLKAWVNYANRNGIAQGYGNGRFGPEDPATRGQAPKILLNLNGISAQTSTTQEFSDVPVTLDLNGFITVAVDKNFIAVNGTRFGINDGITRGEVAEMMYRILVTEENSASTFNESLVVAQSGGVTFVFKGNWSGRFTPNTLSQLAGCPAGNVSFAVGEKEGPFTGVVQTDSGSTFGGGGSVDKDGNMTAQWTVGGTLTSFTGKLGSSTGSGTWSADGCSGTFSVSKS